MQHFLEYIKGGVSANLIIVQGDFTAEHGVADTPDMAIKVFICGKSEPFTATDMVENKKNPIFNHPYVLTWDVSTCLTFVGVEVDELWDDEVFKNTVDATGLFGYDKLSGTLTNEGNKLTIKLEHSIPECPWR